MQIKGSRLSPEPKEFLDQRFKSKPVKIERDIQIEEIGK